MLQDKFMSNMHNYKSLDRVKLRKYQTNNFQQKVAPAMVDNRGKDLIQQMIFKEHAFPNS